MIQKLPAPNRHAHAGKRRLELIEAVLPLAVDEAVLVKGWDDCARPVSAVGEALKRSKRCDARLAGRVMRCATMDGGVQVWRTA